VHVDATRPRMRNTLPRRSAPAGRHVAPKASSHPGNRLVAIAVLAAITVLLLVFQYQFRDVEAAAAARLYGAVTPTLAAPGAPIVWFGLGAPGAFGLVITPDCSSALLIAPLCVLGIGLSIPRKLALRRVCAGLAVAAALLVAGNLARIGLIAVMIRLYGIGTGYQLGHLVLGSLLSVVCIAASLTVLTLIITGRGMRSAARRLLHGRRVAV
jgi:exosortase/archaeosortase family protein